MDQLLLTREQIPAFHEVSAEQHWLTDDERWKTFFLYGYGHKSSENCAKCPVTTRVVEQIPGMTTAMFSILGAGKHIREHRGPYKGVLRCHLAVRIPAPIEKLRLRVGSEVRHWEEGKTLIFDDTFPHEVWHEGDSGRVVLFIDFLRPYRQPISSINRLIVRLIAWSPFVRSAQRNLEALNRR